MSTSKAVCSAFWKKGDAKKAGMKLPEKDYQKARIMLLCKGS